MSATALAGYALALALLNIIGLTALAWRSSRRHEAAATALEDARHEFEDGFAFLDGQIRSHRQLRTKLPPADETGTLK
jgi:HAMP domain-containing protein